MLKTINQFWELRKTIDISSGEADLFFCLLHISEGVSKFEASNKIIKNIIKMSENSIIKNRQTLIEKGLIGFESGKGTTKSIYKIDDATPSNFEVLTPSKFDTPSNFEVLSTPSKFDTPSDFEVPTPSKFDTPSEFEVLSTTSNFATPSNFEVPTPSKFDTPSEFEVLSTTSKFDTPSEFEVTTPSKFDTPSEFEVPTPSKFEGVTLAKTLKKENQSTITKVIHKNDTIEKYKQAIYNSNINNNKINKILFIDAFPNLQSFRNEIKEWSDEKCKHWYDQAEYWSSETNGKKIDWIKTVKLWDNKSPYTPKNTVSVAANAQKVQYYSPNLKNLELKKQEIELKIEHYREIWVQQPNKREWITQEVNYYKMELKKLTQSLQNY
jgi:hypothetical protein